MHQLEFPPVRQDSTASFPGNCSIPLTKGASVRKVLILKGESRVKSVHTMPLFHPDNGRCLHGVCSLHGGPVENLIEASGPAKQQAAYR